MSNSNDTPSTIQLGLCCVNTFLRNLKPSIFTSRTCTLDTIKKYGFDAIQERALQNLDDMMTMLKWNVSNNIRVFRMSSGVFPHFSNPLIIPILGIAQSNSSITCHPITNSIEYSYQSYSIDFAINKLKQIGTYARENGIRLTFHPGQYNVMGTPNKHILRKTIFDLQCHADIFEIMGVSDDSVMVIHGGGTYGNKQLAIDRWIACYNDLPIYIRKRIVLENCEKCFSIVDCLHISTRCGVPVVFDTHHFSCYNALHPIESKDIGNYPGIYMDAILKTWTRRGIKPKFHISEQGCGKVGHHSDFIDTIPHYLLDIPFKFGISIDIMIEAKMKEQAISILHKKYPDTIAKVYTKTFIQDSQTMCFSPIPPILLPNLDSDIEQYTKSVTTSSSNHIVLHNSTPLRRYHILQFQISITFKK